MFIEIEVQVITEVHFSESMKTGHEIFLRHLEIRKFTKKKAKKYDGIVTL